MFEVDYNRFACRGGGSNATPSCTVANDCFHFQLFVERVMAGKSLGEDFNYRLCSTFNEHFKPKTEGRLL